MPRVWRFAALSTLLLLAALVLPEFAFAQQAVPVNAHTNTVLNGVLDVLSIVFEFLQVLAYLSLQWLGHLLDPEFIFAINNVNGNGGEAGLLLRIWQFSRDLMNVLFAFMLVFAALYTVITAKRDLVEEHLTKFVIAVVLVNFSWFFPRVILDVSNVLTATIYQIPASMQVVQNCQRLDEQGNPAPCRFVKNVFLFPNVADDETPAECFNKANPNFITPTGLICIEFGELTDTNTGLGILNGLFINYIRVPEFAKVAGLKFNQGQPILATLQFTVQLIFVLFFMIAAVLPLVAMFVVFLIRIPILWITTAFMPFMFIGFVIGDKLSVGEAGGNTMEIFKKFMAAAFLPTVVAVPLAIGFIMLNAGIECPGDVGGALCREQIPLIAGANTLWVLLWQALSIFVLWTGFFAALKTDSYFSGVGETIKGFGETWFKFLPTLPLSLPIIPTPHGHAHGDHGGGGAKSINDLFLKDFGKKFTQPKYNLLDSRGTFGGTNFGGAPAPGTNRFADVAVPALRKNINRAVDITPATLDRLADDLVSGMRQANIGAEGAEQVVQAIRNLQGTGAIEKPFGPGQIEDLLTRMRSRLGVPPPAPNTGPPPPADAPH